MSSAKAPPLHRRMEEEYVQEHILTGSIVAPVGGCLTSSRCLAIGPYTFNEVRCIRPSCLIARKRSSRPCIASLIETCKLNGLDPQAYFTMCHGPGQPSI
jgi:hypothetical protein